MHVVVTGGDGFIARNLRVRLRELGQQRVTSITRASTEADLFEALAAADIVFHLAGVNRPREEAEFVSGNVDFTTRICALLTDAGRRTPVVYASSTQAALDNPYGRSKLAAEQVLQRYALDTGAAVHVFRLTNVFGKWCRPHYNSVVATFCYQIARAEPITINDPASVLRLIYLDDVVDAFVQRLDGNGSPSGYVDAGPVYETTLGELASTLHEFAKRGSLMVGRVGDGLRRALYATYISYLPPAAFAYEVPRYGDARGVFVEMLKTPDCGQFSYFTAKPGITRGEHYHHTKVEQFLVIHGTARFRFRNIDTGAKHELLVRGGDGHIVVSVPGWAHDVTNIGSDELVIMLWASEIFDRARPDTVRAEVFP
jgi:UDP-2-acetamido-2,6-beta-L-arabino-hexul-4-ose reductase